MIKSLLALCLYWLVGLSWAGQPTQAESSVYSIDLETPPSFWVRSKPYVDAYYCDAAIDVESIIAIEAEFEPWKVLAQRMLDKSQSSKEQTQRLSGQLWQRIRLQNNTLETRWLHKNYKEGRTVYIYRSDGVVTNLDMSAEGKNLRSFVSMSDIRSYKVPSGFPSIEVSPGETISVFIKTQNPMIYPDFLPFYVDRGIRFEDVFIHLESNRYNLFITSLLFGGLLLFSVFAFIKTIQERTTENFAFLIWIGASIYMVFFPHPYLVADVRLAEEFFQGTGLDGRLQQLVFNIVSLLGMLGNLYFVALILNLKADHRRIHQLLIFAPLVVLGVFILTLLTQLALYNFEGFAKQTFDKLDFWLLPPLWLVTRAFVPFMQLVALFVAIALWFRRRQNYLLQIVVGQAIALGLVIFYWYVWFDDRELGEIAIGQSREVMFLLWNGVNIGGPLSAMAQGGLLFIANLQRLHHVESMLKSSLEQQNAIVEAQNQLLESTVEKRTTELRQKHAELESAHALITSSVDYAVRIQAAYLPQDEVVHRKLGSVDVWWEPRDKIGGDIWWVSPEAADGSCTVVLADCTGHGVPGAMLSVTVVNLLDQIVRDKPGLGPGQLLGQLDERLREALNQNKSDGASDDGCDAVAVRLERGCNRVKFAGAKLSLVHVRGDGVVERIAGDGVSLGYRKRELEAKGLSEHEVILEAQSTLVLYSDGLTDQIGGENARGVSFGHRRIAEAIGGKIGAQQVVKRVRTAFEQWQGTRLRRDDVALIAFSPKLSA